MVKYFLRDVRTAVKEKYSLYYIIGMLVLCVLANLSMICFRKFYGLNDGSFGENLIIFAEGAFIIPYYSTIVIAHIIFGRDYPDPHIKDSTTIKMHRWQLYIGKLLGEICLAAIFFVAAVVLFFGVTIIFQIGAGTIDWWTLGDFMYKAFVALPLWIAGLSIGNMCLFLLEKKKNAYITFFVIVLVIPRLIMLLASDVVRLGFCKFIAENLLITPQFTALQFFFTMDPIKCLILGIVYTVISCAIGIAAFYKRK